MARIRFDGETALVAGGGGALGGAYAQMFGALGAKVVVNDISENADVVAKAINDAGGQAIAIIGSAVDRAEQIVAKAVAAFGGLDIVVNSAGQTGGGLFHLIPPAEWDRVFDSHVGATVALARAAWPHLVASGNGRLINTASTAMLGSGHTTTYVGAKAAIFALSRSWAMEGADQNVRVNVVLPTAISQMTVQIPDPRLVELLKTQFQPEKVAGLIGYLAHRDTTLNGLALEAGGGRAAPILMAEAEAVTITTPESPDSWAGHDAALLSRTPKYTPASMMEELEQRLRDMGPSFITSSAVSSDAVWTSGGR